MNDGRRNTFVGIFVVVAVVALAWLMSSFGELPALLGRGEYELKMLVKEPSGIGDGTAIFLSGVQIGRVKEVRFRDIERLDAGAVVVGAIDRDYIIPRNAWAVVQPAGLGLGRGRIDIKVVEGQASEPLPEGEAIIGQMGNAWGDMIPENLLDSVDRSVAQFGNFVEALTPVAHDVHVLLEQHSVEAVDNPIDEARRVTANLSTVIERIDHTLRTFNDTFGHPDVKAGWVTLFADVRSMAKDGSEALENINSISADLRVDIKRISSKLESGIDDANANINAIAADIRPMLQNSAKLTASLLRLSAAMEAGEGSAGMLLKDPRMYESLVMTAQRLTEMVDTIQRLFAKFERDGIIRVGVDTAVGNIPQHVAIPN